MKTYYRELKSFDFFLLLLVIIMCIIGIVTIGSATQVNLYGITSEVKSQIIYASTGLFVLLIAAFIDLRFVNKFYIPIYIVNVVLLILVLLIGNNSSGVDRWISLGPISIQPSEFCKLFMIIFLSRYLELYHDKINTPKRLFITLVLICIPVLLIFLQPSLSASMVVMVLSLVILFVSGLSYKIVIPTVIIGCIGIVFVLYDAHLEDPLVLDLFLKDYQIDRITGESVDQTSYSIQAIASGQLQGKGLFNGSVNQLNYLAESHNDFIFSVLAEEFGFIGCLVVLGIMLLIVMKCLLIGFKSITLQGSLICSGVAALLGFQTFFNVGVGTGLLPNTGVPFPFMSSGGSSMWICMACIGLVLNVSTWKSKSIFEE